MKVLYDIDTYQFNSAEHYGHLVTLTREVEAGSTPPHYTYKATCPCGFTYSTEGQSLDKIQAEVEGQANHHIRYIMDTSGPTLLRTSDEIEQDRIQTKKLAESVKTITNTLYDTNQALHGVLNDMLELLEVAHEHDPELSGELLDLITRYRKKAAPISVVGSFSKHVDTARQFHRKVLG